MIDSVFFSSISHTSRQQAPPAIWVFCVLCGHSIERKPFGTCRAMVTITTVVLHLLSRRAVLADYDSERYDDTAG